MVFIYTVTIFVSAFLLFFVEPMFARMMLPLLGGSSEVWNTSVVFYQVALLVGYLYAHVSGRLLGSARQALLHLPLLALPALVLPVSIPPNAIPPAESSPTGWLLLFLLARLGLPFIILSATSPLLQRWFSQLPHHAAGDPYFLYAASNAGSLVALLGYPLLVEPQLGLIAQSKFWSWGYWLFAGLIILCAVVLWRAGATRSRDALAQQPVGKATGLSWKRRLRWLALAGIPSGLMLSVTTYLTTDIPSIPLLWVIPLALYLLAFIVAFARRRVISDRLLTFALPVSLLVVPLTIAFSRSLPAWLTLAVHLTAFFLIAVKCSIALADDRPRPEQLTDFYLMLSTGGAIGAILNTLVAPLIFALPLEYPLWLTFVALFFAMPVTNGLAGWKQVLIPATAALIVPVALLRLGLPLRPMPVIAGIIFGLPALLALGFARRRGFLIIRGLSFFLVVYACIAAFGNVEYVERSFYGVNRVLRAVGPVSSEFSSRQHQLVHGSTIHGAQNIGGENECKPLTYFYPSGPVGQIFSAWMPAQSSARVAIVGLGAGSLAGYAGRDQEWVFYEIDPAVAKIARNSDYFTYLSNCSENVQVVLGDARLTLAKALPSSYNLLVLDAYSSDTIPVHLATREALQLYLEKLAPGGLVAFHISNRYFDLEPVLSTLATDLDLFILVRDDRQILPDEKREGKTPSTWVILARSPSDFGALAADPRWRSAKVLDDFPAWTDDYSSVLAALRR